MRLLPETIVTVTADPAVAGDHPNWPNLRKTERGSPEGGSEGVGSD